jgi:hypothetical protein
MDNHQKLTNQSPEYGIEISTFSCRKTKIIIDLFLKHNKALSLFSKSMENGNKRGTTHQ